MSVTVLPLVVNVIITLCSPLIPGGTLGYFLGGYVPPETSDWHPVLKKNSPKIDTPF